MKYKQVVVYQLRNFDKNDNIVLHLSIELVLLDYSLLSIYIYKEECLSVCLSVIYAFRPGKRQFSQTLHGIPLRPGEGQGVLFDSKFLPQGVLGTPIVGVLQ
jgi:hypothetical protein